MLGDAQHALDALLAEHFIERLNRLHDRGITGLSDEALAALVRHDWPGNVRELENAIEHAFVLCRGPVIFPEHLPREIAGAPLAAEIAEIAEAPIGRTLGEFEAQIILDALRRNDGQRQKTARELGINKATLWRKMKKLGILAPPGAIGCAWPESRTTSPS